MGYTIEGKKMVIKEEGLDTWTIWERSYPQHDGEYKRSRKGSIKLEEACDDYNKVVMMRMVTEDGDIGESRTGSDVVLYLEDIEILIDGLEKMRKHIILENAERERRYRLNNEEDNE